jgi:hypothetical protein
MARFDEIVSGAGIAAALKGRKYGARWKAQPACRASGMHVQCKWTPKS